VLERAGLITRGRSGQMRPSREFWCPQATLWKARSESDQLFARPPSTKPWPRWSTRMERLDLQPAE